ATDPNSPIASIKEAWEAAKRRTRRHCPRCRVGTLADSSQFGAKRYGCTSCEFTTQSLPTGVQCRFHDLKHTAVSRMLDAGVPITKVAKIVGWSPATMVRMSARYGHFSLEDLRSAVETITRPAVEMSCAPPLFIKEPGTSNVN